MYTADDMINTAKVFPKIRKNDKQKLILLIGASGSGKTTIAKELEKEGYNIIHSYTTREPREANEWGHTFISEKADSKDIEEALKYSSQLMYKGIPIIAFFNDYKKSELYFATEQQYQRKGTSIYIVDPQGANQVKENVKDAEVITIFLMADERIRMKRMYFSRTINEVEERAKKDRDIFKTCKCDYVIDANREIEEVLKDVVDIIG